MNYRTYYYLGIALVVAFSVGRFSAPKSVEIKEVVKTVVVESENINRNQNSVEVVKETRMPDGTFITERTKTKETTTQTERARSSETEKSVSKVVESRPSYRLGVVYHPAVRSFQSEVISGVLEKRLFSELYVGVLVRSDRTVGISLSFGL